MNQEDQNIIKEELESNFSFKSKECRIEMFDDLVKMGENGQGYIRKENGNVARIGVIMKDGKRYYYEVPNQFALRWLKDD